MSIVTKIKRIIALVSILILSVNTAYAKFYTVPADMAQYGQQVYSTARGYHGRSFSGYCGTYVRCQLRAMGIFKDRFDVRGNGNQWYSNFEAIDKTSGGYSVYRESGADCIDKLQMKYGNDLKNIVLSFPIQAGYSASSPGAGHALVIYELRDNIAYYTESFSFSNYSEGEVIAEDIDSLLERYSRRHGEVIGCVMLSSEQNLVGSTMAEKIIISSIAGLETMPMISII